MEAAAGGKALITTRGGGVPKIYRPQSDCLVPLRDAAALACATASALDDPVATADTARKLREPVAASFLVQAMVDGVLAGHRDALEHLRKADRR
ncbi:MAG: hypothetical protein P8Y53_06495 [Pseudolabrys sp.]